MALELSNIQHQKVDADVAQGTNEFKIGSVDSELLKRETGCFDRKLALTNGIYTKKRPNYVCSIRKRHTIEGGAGKQKISNCLRSTKSTARSPRSYELSPLSFLKSEDKISGQTIV